jgi:hypothetical protein
MALYDPEELTTHKITEEEFTIKHILSASQVQERKNLQILADGLMTLPENYHNFGMASYVCAVKSSYTLPVPEEALKQYVLGTTQLPCGTVACAVGHGPTFGLFMTTREADDEDWEDYTLRVFGSFPEEYVYTRLFDGRWASWDNTVVGAAKRIYKLLTEEPESLYAERSKTDIFQLDYADQQPVDWMGNPVCY